MDTGGTERPYTMLAEVWIPPQGKRSFCAAGQLYSIGNCHTDCGRHSQPYSTGGSSEAVFRYQYYSKLVS